MEITLHGHLDGHDKPMLVEEDNHIDICDGFGRLLPYLALVYEGKQFFAFKAYLAPQEREKFEIIITHEFTFDKSVQSAYLKSREEEVQSCVE